MGSGGGQVTQQRTPLRVIACNGAYYSKMADEWIAPNSVKQWKGRGDVSLLGGRERAAGYCR